jgi:hypothetical protein
MEVHFKPETEWRLTELASKCGRVKPVDGEAFFDILRHRQRELLPDAGDDLRGAVS